MSMGGHTGHVGVPKSWQSEWDIWELRGLVIVSLASQILLSLLGYRRKYRVGFFTRALVWSSYLVADWVATFALGVITSKIGDYYDHKNGASNDINPQLIAFWAPFFLMHSGGPWTITAYSLEDSELWPRELVVLISQTLLSLYSILMAWKFNSRLSYLSLAMFVVGVINYGLKVWSLYYATIKHQRDRLSSKVTTTMDSYGNILKNPKDLFRRFMGLFISLFKDVVLSTEYLSKDIKSFQELDSEKAFEVVEKELGFAFDVLYTRASSRYTIWGFISLVITFVATIAVGVLYLTMKKEPNLGWDVTLTYVLLLEVVMTDLLEIVLLILSPWAGRFTPCRLLPEHILHELRRLVDLLGFTRSKSLPQRNFITRNLLEFTRSKSLSQCNFITWIKSIELLNVTPRQITSEMKGLIFTSFRTKSDAIVKGSMSNRGELGNVFDNYQSFEWTKRLEFHQSILTWHIATELCYNYSVDNRGLSDSDSIDYSKVSRILSDYMFYLLVEHRHMLPVGTGIVRSRDTSDQTIKIFQQKCQTSVPNASDACDLLLNKEDFPPKVTEGKPKSVLFDACKLANCLLEIQRKQRWELLSQTWIEIVGYAAIHCRVDNHAQQLRRGGEFVTHIWLLQAHLGLLPQLHLTKEERGGTNTQPSEAATEIGV